MFKIAKSLAASFNGPRSVWKNHKKTINETSYSLIDTLPQIESRISNDVDYNNDNSPIFILSAGWRSGSTLLQRLICSDDNILIWGEPYGDTGLLEFLSEPLRRINEDKPPEKCFITIQHIDSAIENQWIANLYPSLFDLKNSYRVFLDTLFARPAEELNLKRWGIKEVRLNSNHAAFLKWLYPKCKIIFLVRDPLMAFKSYSIYKNWYHIRPDIPIFSARSFGKHWNTLAGDFLMNADRLGAFILKYEDLVSDCETIERLENYLNLKLIRDVLQKRIKSSSAKYSDENLTGYSFSTLERYILQNITSSVAEKFGYHNKWSIKS